jgi:hypothetical protein
MPVAVRILYKVLSVPDHLSSLGITDLRFRGEKKPLEKSV